MQTLNLVFIKNKRESLDITLQDMADKLGFKNASTYLKYENGVYEFKAKQLPILSKVFDCNINDFFKQNIAISATEYRKEVI
jgi:transcriptional regulator with XRE-family HTH domain